jgi:tetratricopeptide (TPR) repeat protein
MLRSRFSIVLLLLALVVLASCGRDAKSSVARGDQFVAARKYHDAAIEYKRALQKDPKLGPARMKLCDVYTQLGDDGNALGECVRGADLLRDDMNAQLKAGQLLLRARRYDDARARARKILDKNPKHLEAQLLFANALAGLNDLDGALKEVEQAVALDPRSGVSYAHLGTILLSKGKRDQAETAFRNATAMDPKSVLAKLALANFLWTTERTTEAETVLKEALAIEPKNTVANRALAMLCLSSNRAAEAEPYLRAAAEASEGSGLRIVLADYYLYQHKTDDAVRVLREASKQPDGFAPAQTRLADIQYDQGRKNEAYDTINLVLKRFPNDAPALMAKARFLMGDGRRDLFARALLAHEEVDAAAQQAQWLQTSPSGKFEGLLLAGFVALARGDTPGATKLLEKALTADPTSMEALSGLVEIDLASGRASQAKARVQALIARDPKNSRAYMLSARVADIQRDKTGLEQSLRKAIEADPSALDAYQTLGRFYASENRLAEAEKEFDAVAARQPKSVAAQTMVAMVLQAQGKTAEARKRYEQILTIDPHAPIAANNLAIIYLEQGGNLDVALQYAQTAKAGRPDQPEINDTLGWIFYKKGLTALALVPLQLAVDKDQTNPKKPEYLFHLGMALAKNGDDAKARTALQAALALDPNFNGAADARKTLASLK